MAEHGDKVGGAEKTAIETALADLKSEVESDSENVEAINAKTQTLMQASMKLGEAMYQAEPGRGRGGSVRARSGRCRRRRIRRRLRRA